MADIHAHQAFHAAAFAVVGHQCQAVGRGKFIIGQSQVPKAQFVLNKINKAQGGLL